MGIPDPKEIIRNRLEVVTASNWPFASLSLETIQLLKSRYDPIYQVHHVTVQETTGQPWRFTFFLTKEADQWHVKTYGGSPESAFNKPVEQYDHPWIQLETLLIGNEFYAFGEVFNQGYPVVRVRLLDPNGLMLEDTVQDDIVLFWSEQLPISPLQLELYDDSDTLISRQKVSL